MGVRTILFAPNIQGDEDFTPRFELEKRYIKDDCEICNMYFDNSSTFIEIVDVDLLLNAVKSDTAFTNDSYPINSIFKEDLCKWLMICAENGYEIFGLVA